LPSFEIVGDASEALLGRSTKFFTPEVFKRELAVDECIDAMIDRAIKRLVQTKAMKQMLGRTSPNGGDDQPKKIHSGKLSIGDKARRPRHAIDASDPLSGRESDASLCILAVL
jgi:hypothetical protein